MKELVYKCDICKKDVNENGLLTVSLPYEGSIDTTVSFISYKPSGKCETTTLEICPDCAMKIHNQIKKFVVIEDIPWVGRSISLVEKENK